MDLASLLDAVMELEREVVDVPAGDPRLGELGGRIDAMERELELARGMNQPLVPGDDAEGPPTAKEATAENLERALLALRSAVDSKRVTVTAPTAGP